MTCPVRKVLARSVLSRKSMRLLLLFPFLYAAALAADDQMLNLTIRAQTDFERVELSVQPGLPETLACVQSQAMMLPVTRPAELSLVHYRKGLCEMLGATIKNDRADFREAARDFGKAIEAWPERIIKKGATPPPVSSGLRVLAATSRLLADGNTDPRVTHDLEEAVSRAECTAPMITVTRCQELVEIGRLWLGWAANREGRLADAARWFQPFGQTGWPALIAGRQAMTERRFPQAVVAFQTAVRQFAAAPRVGLIGRIGPRPNRADAAFRLGSAQFETKDYSAAIESLDLAIRLQPENARAMFARGRAKELLGLSGMADYDLASRTAFATVNAPGASGQAHLYKGVALYRRKDYARAEQEFASALNFDSGAAQRDAIAWRHMSALAEGACGSAAMLQQSMAEASSYFPKDEAVVLVKNCPAKSLSEVMPPSAR
jgi:hypothetical protein